MSHTRKELWLVRHGQTKWSASGQHTGRTDLPLTVEGEEGARELGRFFQGRHHSFGLVLTSPMLRAQQTCRLSGFGDRASVEACLQEWDYGDYEGRTTADIQKERPGWTVWSHGVPRGETIAHVAARAQAVIDRALACSGDVLLFAHGHILRILSCCWLGLPPDAGRLLALGAASVSALGYERDTRVITHWNHSAGE